ncbi:MAG: hypothetical protein HY896_06655 [Deltaproteobacteria bacterium]|nr:hypothetical protein [Deltaproteobacteria bacterium]
MLRALLKTVLAFSIFLPALSSLPCHAALTPGQDIVGSSFTSDATKYYFNLQLAGAPGGTGADDYANSYGIYFIGGAPNPPGNQGEYFGVSTALGENIDAYTYVNYTLGGNTNSIVYGKYKGLLENGTFDSPNFSPMPTFSANGSSLTWTIGKDQLASSFSWLGATFGTGGTFYDKSSVAATPIPNAVWLFGSGVVALVGIKRRRRKA